jgi:aminoglycoside 6'-N-acetyltransferase I
MRLALWPEASPERHEAEMAEYRPEDPSVAAFVAIRTDGGLGGFLEASLRHYADGCDTHPVGYIEGWYVDPGLRRQGVGRALVRAAEGWARGQGCSEMASDCKLDNEVSLRAHLALGYQEAERLIHFRRSLI